MKNNVRLLLIIGMLVLGLACYDGGSGDPGSGSGSSPVGGCDGSTPSEPSEPAEPDEPGHAGEPSNPNAHIVLPPANAPFDYQLGGAYAPPSGVEVVSRDRNDPPAPGLYNICYINGFQVQPDEEALWPDDLILRDSSDNPIIDADWDEMLLDISTASKRERIAAIVGGWIKNCASDGFDAVEIDNLDTYSRSGGRISMNNAVAFMGLLSPIAHANHLAIAQKNSAELLGFKAQMGTDFVVAEECSRYSECSDYIDVYQEHVLMIEYRTRDFDKGCSQYGDTHSIILRDLYLRKPGNANYVYKGC